MVEVEYGCHMGVWSVGSGVTTDRQDKKFFPELTKTCDMLR